MAIDRTALSVIRTICSEDVDWAEDLHQVGKGWGPTSGCGIQQKWENVSRKKQEAQAVKCRRRSEEMRYLYAAIIIMVVLCVSIYFALWSTKVFLHNYGCENGKGVSVSNLPEWHDVRFNYSEVWEFVIRTGLSKYSHARPDNLNCRAWWAGLSLRTSFAATSLARRRRRRWPRRRLRRPWRFPGWRRVVQFNFFSRLGRRRARGLNLSGWRCSKWFLIIC